MAEQQYRVIADRDKGDNPKPRQAAGGDRVTYQIDTNGVDRTLVRIERPVPTTEEPQANEAERRDWLDYQAEHGWATRLVEPDTGADFSAGWERGAAWAASKHPSVPTREQIAEVSDATLVDIYWDVARDDWAIPESVMIAYGRAVLALIEKGTDR